MRLPNIQEINRAAEVVYDLLPQTPQLCWPMLSERVGAEVWVKHENLMPIGAFKVRGGVFYMHELAKKNPDTSGVITATRGNHGQSIAMAASRLGLRAVIVVPHGNSRSKNHAMKSLGAELIEHGQDFDTAAEYAGKIATERGLVPVPSFDPALVTGVATYAKELFENAPTLDTVYVPIGMGSGICGVISVREALGLETEVVGVVSSEANTYALSLKAGRPIITDTADTMADGLAVRQAHPLALDIISTHAARVLEVSDEEICAAIRHYYTDCHQVAEGAAAAPLAALLKERDAMQGKRVGLVFSGGNIDRDLFARIIASG